MQQTPCCVLLPVQSPLFTRTVCSRDGPGGGGVHTGPSVVVGPRTVKMLASVAGPQPGWLQALISVVTASYWWVEPGPSANKARRRTPKWFWAAPVSLQQNKLLKDATSICVPRVTFSCLLPLQEALRYQLGLTWVPLKLLLQPRACEILCEPFKSRVCFLQPSKFLDYNFCWPQTFGGLIFPVLGQGSSMWGSDSLIFWRNLCNCDYPPTCDHLPMGVRLDCTVCQILLFISL